jgi:hypothetical protein
MPEVEVVEKPFARLSGLLRALQKAYVAEVGVDQRGLVGDARAASVLQALARLIAAAEEVQQRVDELEFADRAAYAAFERAEGKAAGMKG